MSLRLRFGMAGAAVVLLLVSLGVIISEVVTTSQISQVDRQLTEAVPRALVLTKSGAPSSHQSSNKQKPSEPNVTERFSDIYIAVINGKNRNVLVALEAGNNAPALPTVITSAPNAKPNVETVTSLKGSVLWRALLVRQGDGQEILIASSLQSLDATNHELRLVLLVGGAALVLIGAALWWWLVRLGLSPIADVTSVADAITAGDRSRRVGESPRGSEAARLAEAINMMLDEEQATEERLRRFTADASHELRTPLTAIQGIAELWRDGVLADTDTIADAFRRVGQESTRMRALVEDLLLLARLDAMRPIAHQPVDLAELARDVVSEMSAMFPSYRTTEEIDDSVTTTGDESQLRQVLTNLLGNAYVHTPPGTRVTIRVKGAGDQRVIEVEDDGPGMEPEDRAHAFERFWRGTPARSGPGSGLGLSIVAEIVAAHHGSIEMSTAPGRGTSIRATLPA